MVKETAKPFPSTSLPDIVRLAGGLAGSFIRGPRSFDASLALREWINAVAARRQSDDFIINLYFKRVLLVTGRDLSSHILGHAPSSRTYMEGPTKAGAMLFLAPQALTICHDQQWERLRPYNERVLSLEANPQRRQVFLNQVRRAFYSSPISGIPDVRSCMRQVMLDVVFGEGRAPAYLAEDIQVLFGYVQSPVRRILLGRRQSGRRERFYRALEGVWQDRQSVPEASLLSAARQLAAEDGYTQDELLQQIPHWMFTFTGSGTDLLSRALALIAARPSVREVVEKEITDTGPPDRDSTIDRLAYLEGCLLETCRLFPPVTRTFHIAPQGDLAQGRSVPPGVEIMHYFTAKQRDTEEDPTANEFRPERWVGSDSDAASTYPHLFLGGARACPGQSLILFICKAATALLLKERRLEVEAPSLATDPLPPSFPERAVRFSG